MNYKIIYSCKCGSVLHTNNGIRTHYNTKKHQLYTNILNPFIYDLYSRNHYYYFNDLTAHIEEVI